MITGQDAGVRWNGYVSRRTADSVEEVELPFRDGVTTGSVVVPGVGVFGLTGGLMVIFSLVLASQTFTFPRSGAEMDEMRRSMSIVVGAGGSTRTGSA